MTSCPECGGIGLIPRMVDGVRISTPCRCQTSERHKAMIARSRIPTGYLEASFQTFKKTETNCRGLMMTQQFVREFIPGMQARSQPGLLLTGSVGVGKTHLAAAALRQLVEEKGVYGRFVDVRELLDKLRSSYGDDARESQAQILGPLLNADLVVIDELGAARPSDWVFETIELLIGGLYNRVVPVIVTTNLANLAAGANGANNDYARAARQETLGDRIGMRMWSRLQEMCVSVDMTGPDWRVKRG
jgi:DNA replication protein DnaC